jgi:cysteine desulfurase/selenocysteine lyase
MTLYTKNDFPMLSRKVFEKEMIYLDSAACSFKPIAVIEAERSYGISLTSNVHRSHNALSDHVSHEYESARRKIANFIHSDPNNTIMTPNTSYALAMVARGLNLSKEDKVLCSSMNHHSNLLPWMDTANIVYFQCEGLKPLDTDVLTKAIKLHRPKVLAISYVSNVTGIINPITEICKLAREYGVTTVVDAAQAAPHIPINVVALDCDFLAFSGHKMLGPTGTGVLYGRYQLLEFLKPLVVGGGTVDKVELDGYALKPLPHRLEPGTPNISGVLGLGAAVDYIQSISFEAIMAHENELKKAMRLGLADLPGVDVLFGNSGSNHIAIASIAPTEANIDSSILCQILSDNFQIMTRAGFHCSQQFFKTSGYTKGAVRISPYIYNTAEDIYKVSDALRTILARFA